MPAVETAGRYDQIDASPREKNNTHKKEKETGSGTNFSMEKIRAYVQSETQTAHTWIRTEGFVSGIITCPTRQSDIFSVDVFIPIILIKTTSMSKVIPG